MAAEFLERMGVRIRERREEMGLSRADVAREMPGKVSENQVYRWEKGLHQPKSDTLEALAGVLERDVSYFMATPPDKTDTPDPFPASDGAVLAEINRRLGVIEERLDALTEAARGGRPEPPSEPLDGVIREAVARLQELHETLARSPESPVESEPPPPARGRKGASS
jgi:transcriptional regulator with XRE-family HTH domain